MPYHSSIDNQESSPSRSLMTWEEYENGKDGQLNLPGFTEMPTLAERAFLILAREWRASKFSSQERTKAQGAREEISVLSCLLLASRWGRTFTPLPLNEVQTNRYKHSTSATSQWLDDLAWDLCTYALSDETERQSRTIESLIANLSHHSSSIRGWILDLAWLAHSELPTLYARQAVNELLKNVAVCCCDCSAVLAARFFLKSDDFVEYACQYRPPAGYEAQYEKNVKRLKGELPLSQQAFAHTESECWTLISETLFASYFVPHRLHPAFSRQDLFEHLHNLSAKHVQTTGRSQSTLSGPPAAMGSVIFS